jgi:hypothetical protein
MQKITPSNIIKLKKNEIFVFGSNLLGEHLGGAAKFALDKFGAVLGQPIGLQGKSYAFPTLDTQMKKLDLGALKIYVRELQVCAINNPQLHFLITEVGCGIAGFTHAEIAPLFKDLLGLDQFSLPQAFIDILTVKKEKYGHVLISEQFELDALVEIKAGEQFWIEGINLSLKHRFSIYGKLVINSPIGRNSSVVARENSSVEAWGNSSVEAWGNSSVVARENSSVEAWGNSSVEAWGNSSVVAWGNSSVVARENSSVVARENSSVVARENSSVVAWGNSSVVARENSSVVARENSSVVARENSSVEAWGNSSVVARENSSVVAWENSSVVAWGNSSVEARENSSVVAWGNSSVVARENSSVEAWENSSVVAWGNSSVVARGNSSVEARGNSSVVARGNSSVKTNIYYLGLVLLFGFSALWIPKNSKAKYEQKSKTTTVITYHNETKFLEREGVNVVDKKVVIFKRVSHDWKTQENTKNETLWIPKTTVEHHDWRPESGECGEGKYHACSRPYFCDEFRSTRTDRYVAIEVEVKDLKEWENPQYPHKIAFRKCNVLFECNKLGKEVKN